MHELGVVYHIMKKLDDVAAENNISKIGSVTLQLGEVSGVIPHYLTDCWKWASSKNAMYAGSALNIETIEAVTYCEDCEQTYETVKYGRKCPHCGSDKTYLQQGSEFMIKEIEAQ